MKESIYILHKHLLNKDFKESIHETKNIILDALPYIKFRNEEQYIKTELKENLESKKDEVDENVPDEFLDPLIYTFIKNPVMIPHVDMIFDRTSIMSQIYHEKINPYTRELLDENILNTYNLSPDVICKVEEFNMKLNQWKTQNIKI